MTILDKAQQVAADTLAELGFRATADAVIKNLPVRHQPSEYVCAVLDALSAANLLAREPKELTDEEIENRVDALHHFAFVKYAAWITFARWVVSQAYPDYATMEKELAEAKEKIAELEATLKRPTFCGPNLRIAQAAVSNWRDSDITSEARVARNFINNCKPISEVEAPLREKIDKLRTAIARAGFSVMQTSGDWSIHDTSKLGEAEAAKTLEVVNRNVELEIQVKEQAEEIERLKAEITEQHSFREQDQDGLAELGKIATKYKAQRDQLRIDNEQLRGELATALDAREKRVRELLAKLDRGEDKACIELYSNGTVQIANADGDILDVQVIGLVNAIAALEEIAAEKKPEPTPEETIAKPMTVIEFVDGVKRAVDDAYESFCKQLVASEHREEGVKP